MKKSLEKMREYPENWEEETDPKRRDWSLRHGFFSPTLKRYGLCWTCNYEGHRLSNKVVLPLEREGPNCSKCSQFGLEAKWCRVLKKELQRPHSNRNPHPPKNRTREMPGGHPSTMNKR